jgi:putative addiction module killer protein
MLQQVSRVSIWKVENTRFSTTKRRRVHSRLGSGAAVFQMMATRIAIDVRIARFRGGNFGNSRSLGGGLFENKIDFGPGYRIYYATDGNKILLLCAGDKSSQDIDLKRAEKYLEDYKKREKERKATQKKENAKLQGRPLGRSKK